MGFRVSRSGFQLPNIIYSGLDAEGAVLERPAAGEKNFFGPTIGGPPRPAGILLKWGEA